MSLQVRSIVPFSLAAIAVASAALLLNGCSSGEATTGAAPAPIEVSVERDVTQWDEFTGRLEAVESVEIRPRVTGYIESVNFTEGSLVRKGDLLFVIDPRPYRAELSKAEAELTRATARAELAESDVARSEKLRQIKAVSQEEFDTRVNAAREARANVAGAVAAVDAARLNLEFTRVVAPIAGRISKAAVTAGNLVTGGTNQAPLLTTIVSVDPIYVSFEGDEQVYLKYQELAHRGDKNGDKAAEAERPNSVQMGLANEQGYPHLGSIVFVDNQIDPRTGTIRSRAAFDNKDGRFTPGLFARVKLLGHDSFKAVLVDDRAVGTDQSQKFVYVVGADNKVAYRTVKVGRLTDGLRIITEGLQPGESVVVNGLQRVRPGAVIAPHKVVMDAREASETQLAKNVIK
jgi:multidrug efflux system membrane fusion protein